ncbi:MAG TPA: ECF-type sigma factor [Bryobacteraceae bacterium]
MSGQSQAAAITGFLHQWRDGDASALERLTDCIYGELRRLASSILAGEGGPRSVDPTALVHELYLRLPGVQQFDWRNRAQFMNTAARMMRNVLVDHARKRKAAKRGASTGAESFDDCVVAAGGSQLDVLVVNDALDRFAQSFPRQARVLELKFFGGLDSNEIREVLNSEGEDFSLRTVERDWTFARAWLHDAIGS